MRLPLVPVLLPTAAVVTAAAMYDLAMAAGYVSLPWFGWMLP